MLLIELHDEWLVGRRYLSQESLALLAIPKRNSQRAPAWKRSKLNRKRKETAKEVTPALAA